MFLHIAEASRKTQAPGDDISVWSSICPLNRRAGSSEVEHQISNLGDVGSNPTLPRRERTSSEYSSAWLEHTVWDREVRGSNPLVPT